MHVLVAGAGWLGIEVVRALVARGESVTAVRRGESGRAALVAAGAWPVIADLARGESVEALPLGLDAIVSCVAASGEGPEAYRTAYVDANRTLLAYAQRHPLRAFVYTGSTGVFGRSDGGDVEETTPPEPASEGGRILLEAERLVLSAAAHKVRASVVRLSGLYGPGRAGIVERVNSGRLALGPGDDAWMNFCHRDDAVAAVLAALDHGRRAAIYHATDAFPTRRRDVVAWIAARLGIAPPHAPAGAAAPARGAHRRVLGVATRRELGLTLLYPSFREGLEPFILDAL
jgi:nucleoside-diphosphate-sugar epimerase